MAVFTGNGSAASPSLTFSSDTSTGIFRSGTNSVAITTNGVRRFNVDGSGAVIIDTNDATIFGVRVGRGAAGLSTNTVVGNQAFNSNTTGIGCVAVGFNALRDNTTGIQNTAVGITALRDNTIGLANTAVGYRVLEKNTTGDGNIAIGFDSLLNSTTADFNTAIGFTSLRDNTTGIQNTASGSEALRNNTTGIANTASGFAALRNNTTGDNNVAVGFASLLNNTTGGANTAIGDSSLAAITSGNGNIGVGGKNNVGVYTPVFNPITENNRIVMGSTSVTNAYVQVAWTVVSDQRDKMNFAPVPHGLDFVNALKPTAYQFKIDRNTEESNGPVRYGFKAQDILALEGDNAIIIDTEDPEKLRYNGEALVPVLVNAIQELAATVKQLQDEITILKGAN